MHTAPIRFEQPDEPDEPDARERCPRNPLSGDSPGSACCDEASFAEIVQTLVIHEAPQLFAVVRECGERTDRWIVAWGLAFRDHAEVVSPAGLRLSVLTAHEALHWFVTGPDTRARLIWCRPDPGAPGDEHPGT